MKKALSLLLVFVMLFAAAPMAVGAAGEESVVGATRVSGDIDSNPQSDVAAGSPDGETGGSRPAPTKSGADLAQTGDEPSFDSVAYPTDGAGLKMLLEADGNIKIELNRDLSFRIGEEGDRYSDYVEYWCTLGSGTKVLQLNGHDITLYNDRDEQNKAMHMFRVPSGAELVINDSKNSGTINYSGMLKTGSEYTTHYHKNKHHLIEVTGGKLTVNGGILEAGRSNKFYAGWDATYFYRQINGTAIIMSSGEVQINGGEIMGRGFTSVKYDIVQKRAAAIEAIGGKLTIYDGEFWGKGCADVLQIGDEVDIKVYGGTFDTHKQDYEIAMGSHYGLANFPVSTTYGNIGLPGRACSLGAAFFKTAVNKNGTGNLSVQQIRADETLETSKRVTVTPVKDQSFAEVDQYDTATGGYKELPGNTTYEWDKSSPLKFYVYHTNYYPSRTLRSFDEIKKYEHNNVYASLRKSFDGLAYVKAVPADGMGFVDLNDMPQEQKDKLPVGQTFYLRFTDSEVWDNGTGQHTINHRDTKMVTVRIVEPDMTAPDVSLGYEWENVLDGNGKNTVKLTPAGDGTQAKLNVLLRTGRITLYRAHFYYYNTAGVWTSYDFEDNITGTTTITDMQKGVTRARYQVELFKGDTKISTPKSDTYIVNFPNLTSSVAADRYNRVQIEASAANRTVTLGRDGGSADGIFWAKDGEKIAGSAGMESYPVDLSNADNIGYYAIGYTIDGVDYISPQSYALGIKAGDLATSALATSYNVTIRNDGDATPYLAARATGSGWGTITSYKWRLTNAPSAYYGAKVHTVTSQTVALAKLLDAEGYEVRMMPQGDYTLQCTITDNYGHKATTAAVTVHVNRPPTGIEIFKGADGIVHNLTDSFSVLSFVEPLDDMMELGVRYLPENAVGEYGKATFTSSDESVAEVNNYGDVHAIKPGTATITATYGDLTASTRVLVSKSLYDVTVPEEWLDVKAGGKVYRGALSVPSSEDFTAELIWNIKGTWSDREYTADTFVGNEEYYPTLRIYPKKGVVYPVDVEESSSGTYYYIARDDFEISVNDETYYGATYCGRDYYTDEPVSAGDSRYDYIEMDMDSTGKITDWRDDYLDRVVFSLDVPSAGQPKDVTADEDTLLNTTVQTDGVDSAVYGVVHITDRDTAGNDTIADDKSEDFTTYEAGEIYRAYVWLAIDRSFVTINGGRTIFSDNGVTAIEPELGCITDDSGVPFNYVIAYVYFTPSDESSGDVSGTVTSYLSAADKVTLDLIPQGGTEAKYSTYVFGNSETYTLENVAAGDYTLRVSKNNHVTRDYAVTVSGGTVKQDVKIHLKGDINGDGVVNVADYARVNAHVRNVRLLSGYELRCADVVGNDGIIKVADAARINAHVRGVNKMW